MVNHCWLLWSIFGFTTLIMVYHTIPSFPSISITTGFATFYHTGIMVEYYGSQFSIHVGKPMSWTIPQFHHVLKRGMFTKSWVVKMAASFNHIPWNHCLPLLAEIAQAILTFRWGGLNEIIAPAQWGETGGGGVRPGGWWLARKGLLTNLCMLYIYIYPSLSVYIYMYIYISISTSRSIFILYWLGITRNPRTGNHVLNQAGLNGMIFRVLNTAQFSWQSVVSELGPPNWNGLKWRIPRETPLLQYL